MSLGQDLSSARLAAKLTIEDLAKRTNLRASLLSEFEANQFINAGGDIYARGHLKSISRALGIDAEILLSAYDAEHAHNVRPIHEQLVENSATFSLPERNKLTQKQLITYSVIGIVVLILASATINNLKQSASSPKPAVSKSAAPTPSVSASPTPSVAASANTYSSGTGVTVQLAAVNGSSWLFVSDDAGTTLYSGRASDGQVFEFSSTNQVNLRIGNAGAVKLTVNGKEVPTLGGDGEVVNVSYGVNS